MNHRPNSRPLVLSRLNHTLLNEVVKVALLRVVVVVLGLGPVVDTVEEHEGGSDVRKLLHGSSGTVEDVGTEHTGKGTLAVRGETIGLDTPLLGSSHVTPPTNPGLGLGHARVGGSCGPHGCVWKMR